MPTKGRCVVIGVMGGSVVHEQVLHAAEEMGMMIAQAGYVLLTGGRPTGVMEAASRGAREAGGLVVGVLPGTDQNEASIYVNIAIASGLSDARNLINVLSSDVVVACQGGAGTLSEVALAVKNQRPLVLLSFDPGPVLLGAEENAKIAQVASPSEAMRKIHIFLGDDESSGSVRKLPDCSDLNIFTKPKD